MDETKTTQSETFNVELNYEFFAAQIEEMRKALRIKDAEVARLRGALDGSSPSGKKKKKLVEEPIVEYSDYKSDGVRKPHPADSIRSYDDFKAIQEYFLSRGRIRDWAMWTIGVSLGLRVSDLFSLKFHNIFENDGMTFRPRIQIYERKTGKLQNCLITDSVKDAMTRYLDSLEWKFDMDGYVFASKKTGGKMYEECGWRILSNAGKELHLPITVGSHTMRKSFANIAACVDRSSVDMNSITKVQGLLNHSDQKCTMRYLGSYQQMFDRARVAVSDFVLGKTSVKSIVAGNGYSIGDVMEKMEALEQLINQKGASDVQT